LQKGNLAIVGHYGHMLSESRQSSDILVIWADVSKGSANVEYHHITSSYKRKIRVGVLVPSIPLSRLYYHGGVIFACCPRANSKVCWPNSFASIPIQNQNYELLVKDGKNCFKLMRSSVRKLYQKTNHHI
jgi:hypothetical protein